MRIGFSLVVSLLILSGCAAPNPILITEVPVVFIPDSKYFYCPVITEFPNPATLSDVQVAELIVTLDAYNRDCRDSLDAVLVQLNAARTQLEQSQ